MSKPVADGGCYDVSIIDVWAVHQGDDDRHSGYPEWFFTSPQEAYEVAAGRGWYGGDAPVSEKKAIVLDGETAYLLKDIEPLELNVGPDDLEERRKNALSKLTDIDKKVLGLL